MIAFPEHNAALTLPGPVGKLQAMLEFPAQATARTPVALICHPHPPDGGSMTNKVVSTLAKAFNECGYAALRFNFRGVGASEGAYDGGAGELADCLAVLDWLRSAAADRPLALAGFSFGAWIALLAAGQLPAPPRCMVSIAPPVGFRDFAGVPHPHCPWLAVQGAADEIVDAGAVMAWLEAQQPRPEIVSMPDTSHFFHGKLVPLRAHVAAFLSALPHPA